MSKPASGRAAVYFADDPRALNVARVIPADAQIKRIGNCIAGYTKAPVAVPALPPRHQRFSLAEMAGRGHRKALRALVRLREGQGVVIDDTAAWATAAADIAAAIFGPDVTVKQVEGQCLYLGIEVDRKTIMPLAARAAQWRRSPDYTPLSGEELGALVRLGWQEREVLVAQGIGAASRLGSFDETPDQRRKRKDRERKAGQRAEARSPKAPKPWEALGMSRSTFYNRRRVWTDSVRTSLKEGKADKNSPSPGNADRICPTFETPPAPGPNLMGKADKNSPKRASGGRK